MVDFSIARGRLRTGWRRGQDYHHAKVFYVMAVAYDIQIGERFKPAGRSVFGFPSGEVFEVRDIRVESFIVPHAQLFNIRDPLDIRLISVSALRDTNFFVSVEFQSIEFRGHVANAWRN